ncbi:IclR family transcriptional regulator [Asaia astilbis]|uniref:IclR family transcriptional regulator n=1 Tax=Asaia astilbis TaxID=610244 RepID=UPI00046F3976|nr:IclR family transcriptional regulator [Asaia astilbis]
MSVNEGDRYLVPALLHGLAILECFEDSTTELSLAEVTRRAELPRASAFRLVQTLRRAGYLVGGASPRLLRLGEKCLSLGRGREAGKGLIETAMPILEALRDETSCSTHLAQREGHDIVYVARCAASGDERSVVDIGTRLPAHATVIGRAILSQMLTADVVGLYQEYAFPLFTSATPDDLSALVRQVEEDRNQRSLASWGYFENDIVSIASVVRDRSGNVLAALSAVCAHGRHDRALLEDYVRPCVEKAALLLSSRLV